MEDLIMATNNKLIKVVIFKLVPLVCL